MEVLPQFVDMAKNPKEIAEDGAPLEAASPSQNLYPYGLSICLTNEELDKLDLDDDVDTGDTVHLFCLAKVTTVTKTDTTDGPKCRVEMQITHIAVESEDEENEQVMRRRPTKDIIKKAYGE